MLSGEPRGEAELVRAAQGGSEEAVEALFRRHWRRAHRAAFLIVRDAGAAEDIAQEAFLAALRALDRFDRRRPFRPWLHRIVVNRAIDHARARALRQEVGEEAIADRIGPGAPRATPVLASLPGDGSLLVDSGEGPWVVHPDGSKRLLGRYAEASWSPHGLFAVVTGGHELAAVEPDGTVRWALARPGRPHAARWNGPDGFRIAYLEGRALRVVDADGTADRRLAGSVADVAPAWMPGPAHLLAYATRRGAVVAAGADSGGRVFATAPGPPIRSLRWEHAGLLVTRAGRLQLLRPSGSVAWTWTPLPPARIRAATPAPGGRRVAAVVRAGRTSRLLLLTPGRPARVLFAGPGRFAAPRWSPDGRWLLLPWPSADQWLFLDPTAPHSGLHAVANVAAQFSPGRGAAARFPSVAGWCCSRR